MAYCYEYPRPALTVDSLVFSRLNNSLRILLIKRKNPPFKNCWALPGGFVDKGELLTDAAARELHEETGLEGIELELLGVFDNPERDPRERTITIAYLGEAKKITIMPGSDAADVKWFTLNNLPALAFDHKEILDAGFRKIGNTGH